MNLGQTVVASLNAPNLFLIAKDLTRMQVWVAVNEADIGNIHPGQPVTFLVDAFPGQIFTGVVGKVRLNAQMTQNVVTYTVEVTTDNSSGKLLPYLTANVQFEQSRHNAVLQVPNAALRWTPAKLQIAPEYRNKMLPGDLEPASRPARDPTTRTRGAATAPRPPRMQRGTLWIKEGNFVRPLAVRTGISDSLSTEVQGEGLTEGMEVVTGVQRPNSGAVLPGTQNPFAPAFPGRRPAGSGGSPAAR